MGSIGVLVLLGQLASDAGLEPPPPPPEAARVDAGAPGARAGPAVRVTLRDGQSLDGELVEERADGTLLLRLGSGAVLTLDRTAVASVAYEPAARPTPEGEGWFRDVNQSRYLWGPSARMLRRNELSFSQTELALSSLTWGATDWLSVQVSTAVPAWFLPPLPTGVNLLLGVKVGFPVTDYFHLGGGLQGVWFPGLGSVVSVPLVGLASLTATVGTADLHASLTVGLPLSAALVATTVPVLGLAGSWRVARGLALVTEHVVVLSLPGGLGASPAPLVVANSLAARIMGEHLAFDLGLLTLYVGNVFVPFPIPWVTFTYTFSAGS